jgi:hypothetical protein
MIRPRHSLEIQNYVPLRILLFVNRNFHSGRVEGVGILVGVGKKIILRGIFNLMNYVV